MGRKQRDPLLTAARGSGNTVSPPRTCSSLLSFAGQRAHVGEVSAVPELWLSSRPGSTLYKWYAFGLALGSFLVPQEQQKSQNYVKKARDLSYLLLPWAGIHLQCCVSCGYTVFVFQLQSLLTSSLGYIQNSDSKVQAFSIENSVDCPWLHH